MTCDWRRIGRAKLGEGVISTSARSGVVEEADVSGVATASEDGFDGCTPAEALIVKAAVGAVPLTGTLAEGMPDDCIPGVLSTGVGRAAGVIPADGRLVEGTLVKATIDKGRTGGNTTEGKSGGSTNIGDGMKGEGGCAEGRRVGVVTEIAVPDPVAEIGTVSGGAVGGAAVSAGVAIN